MQKNRKVISKRRSRSRKVISKRRSRSRKVISKRRSRSRKVISKRRSRSRKVISKRRSRSRKVISKRRSRSRKSFSNKSDGGLNDNINFIPIYSTIISTYKEYSDEDINNFLKNSMDNSMDKSMEQSSFIKIIETFILDSENTGINHFVSIDLELIISGKIPNITLMQLCLEHGNYGKNIIMIDWGTTDSEVKLKVKELFMNNNIIKLLWGGGGDLNVLFHHLFALNNDDFAIFLNNLYDIQYLYREYIRILEEKKSISLYESLRDMHLISHKKFNELSKISVLTNEEIFKKRKSLTYKLFNDDINGEKYAIYCLSDVLYLKDFFIFFIINFGEDTIKKINKKYNLTDLKKYIESSDKTDDEEIIIDVKSFTLFPEIDKPPESGKEKGIEGENEALKLAEEYKKKLSETDAKNSFEILLNYNLNKRSIAEIKKELQLKDPSNPKAGDKFKGELDIIIADKNGIVYYIFESKSDISVMIPDSEKIINLINFCNGKSIIFYDKENAKVEKSLIIDLKSTTSVYTINKKEKELFKGPVLPQFRTLNVILIGSFIKLCVESINPSIVDKNLLILGKITDGKPINYVLDTNKIDSIFNENFDKAYVLLNTIIENFDKLNKEIYIKDEDNNWMMLKTLSLDYKKPDIMYIEINQLFGTIANVIIEKKGIRGKVDKDALIKNEITEKIIYHPVDLNELLSTKSINTKK
jgi:hypothetical protein